jgi:hypothetical protein
MRRGGANDKDCRPNGDGAAEGCTRVASPRFTPRFAPLWDVGRLYPSGESCMAMGVCDLATIWRLWSRARRRSGRIVKPTRALPLL